ncbi:hypothetical protein HPB48_006102 [Haemaphysalis longicornis]|uniref:Uncharacterized protein n=1 Tax=Haemaphysalis longicornis TaxID=44386 RepID=A0A9J6GRY2_HAELO|nr:hypothetical protein HPB48_006102 [Haemaphysalis longicornis]
MYFFNEMFKKAGRGDKRNSVLDVMAVAAQHFDKMATNIITKDSLEGCMEKAARGTHVFVGLGKMHCWYNLVPWYRQGYIVEGQEMLLVFPVGFAMRKDYYLRREIDLIARRLFETGWYDALDRQFYRKCLTNENFGKESILPDNRHLLSVLGGGCSLSRVFLCAELLVDWTAKLYRGHMPASIGR